MAQEKKEMEALAGALQRVTVEGGDSVLAGVEDSLSASERAAVLKLKQLQEEHSALSARFEADVLRLKLEYEEKYKPLYKERLEVLAATANPAGDQAAEKETTGTPGLPSFWLRALKANRLLADIIEEYDEGPLSYLKDITCEWLSAPLEDKKEEGNIEVETAHGESFRLKFEFAENPFFTPLTLIKEYWLAVGEGGRGAELIRTKGTSIMWEKNKDITKKTVVRRQRNRKTKQTRTITETVDANSFFNLFADHEIPSDDKLQQMDEKEVEELQMVVEADYDIGITIRDKIIPRAVDWYLGQVDDDSDFDDYDANDEEFDSEESDEEEDSSDEEPPRPHKGAEKATIDIEKGGADQKPECKQQ